MQLMTYLTWLATVQTLFLFYQNSAVHMAGLQEVLDDPVIKLKQAKDVRWLSHAAEYRLFYARCHR